MSVWQPITTAPKEATVILYSASPKARYRIVIGRWRANWGWQSEPGAWPVSPSHWMPLPEQPA